MHSVQAWQLSEQAIPAMPEAQNILVGHGLSLRLWRLYAFSWLICLVFPVVSLSQSNHPLLDWVISLTALAAFTFVYTTIMWPYPLQRVVQAPGHIIKSVVWCGLLTTLIIFLSLAEDRLFLWLLVGLSAITGIILPLRAAFVTIIVLTLLTLGVGMVLSGDLFRVDWLHILPLVLLVRGLGLDMIGLARLADTVLELHRARQELARLAVAEERLRMARDLHDLLGHTLSLITIKSELAGRLVEKEPGRAIQEIREIELVTRQTMREVREAVAGYRQPQLESELLAVRQMLATAQIALDLEIEESIATLSPALNTTLAWMVREGVTNVIRHSCARRCLVRVKREGSLVRAEVINDGLLEQASLLRVSGRHSGSGLSGLVERVTALEGRLEAGPVVGKWGEEFRLWVELPVEGTKNRERAEEVNLEAEEKEPGP